MVKKGYGNIKESIMAKEKKSAKKAPKKAEKKAKAVVSRGVYSQRGK